jgi:hypothetical protein
MPDTVKLPVIGPTKKGWVWAGGLAVAGAVIYSYWRSSTTPVAAPGEGELTTDDLAYTGDVDAFAGARTPGGETYDPSIPGDGPPTTNAEWTQRVIDSLEGVGYTRDMAANTIGKYLSGQPLTAAERILIQAAIAIWGNPPAGALPMIDAPTPPTQPPGTPPSPHKGNIVGAHGTRLTSNTTLIALARRYAALPSNGDSVEGTKRWILIRNPWLAARGLNKNSSVLKRGWIIIVPTRAKMAS